MTGVLEVELDAELELELAEDMPGAGSSGMPFSGNTAAASWTGLSGTGTGKRRIAFLVTPVGSGQCATAYWRVDMDRRCSVGKCDSVDRRCSNNE